MLPINNDLLAHTLRTRLKNNNNNNIVTRQDAQQRPAQPTTHPQMAAATGPVETNAGAAAAAPIENTTKARPGGGDTAQLAPATVFFICLSPPNRAAHARDTYDIVAR